MKYKIAVLQDLGNNRDTFFGDVTIHDNDNSLWQDILKRKEKIIKEYGSLDNSRFIIQVFNNDTPDYSQESRVSQFDLKAGNL